MVTVVVMMVVGVMVVVVGMVVLVVGMIGFAENGRKGKEKKAKN